MCEEEWKTESKKSNMIRHFSFSCLHCSSFLKCCSVHFTHLICFEYTMQWMALTLMMNDLVKIMWVWLLEKKYIYLVITFCFFHSTMTVNWLFLSCWTNRTFEDVIWRTTFYLIPYIILNSPNVTIKVALLSQVYSALKQSIPQIKALNTAKH